MAVTHTNTLDRLLHVFFGRLFVWNEKQSKTAKIEQKTLKFVAYEASTRKPGGGGQNSNSKSLIKTVDIHSKSIKICFVVPFLAQIRLTRFFLWLWQFGSVLVILGQDATIGVN